MVENGTRTGCQDEALASCFLDFQRPQVSFCYIADIDKVVSTICYKGSIHGISSENLIESTRSRGESSRRRWIVLQWLNGMCARVRESLLQMGLMRAYAEDPSWVQYGEIPRDRVFVLLV